MKRYILAALLSTLALGQRSALAHDAKLHAGNPVEGRVVAVQGDSLRLRTESGEEAISLDAKTKFERGDGVVSKEALRPGDRVSVYGTKLEDGMVAREVRIHTDGDEHPAGHGEPHGTGTQGGS